LSSLRSLLSPLSLQSLWSLWPLVAAPLLQVPPRLALLPCFRVVRVFRGCFSWSRLHLQAYPCRYVCIRGSRSCLRPPTPCRRTGTASRPRRALRRWTNGPPSSGSLRCRKRTPLRRAEGVARLAARVVVLEVALCVARLTVGHLAPVFAGELIRWSQCCRSRIGLCVTRFCR
jgi:hypothetical protein